MSTRLGQDPFAFGEKLLNLLDEGAFTATYKYAVLLGLIDLCMEKNRVDILIRDMSQRLPGGHRRLPGESSRAPRRIAG